MALMISFLAIRRGGRRSGASGLARPQRHGARRDEGGAAHRRFRAARIEQRKQRRRAVEPRRTLRVCRIKRGPRPATFLRQLF